MTNAFGKRTSVQSSGGPSLTSFPSSEPLIGGRPFGGVELQRRGILAVSGDATDRRAPAAGLLDPLARKARHLDDRQVAAAPAAVLEVLEGGKWRIDLLE
jgi:hypothetical protein